MKKKIINGLLMAALVAGTTSSFVSCKDYNEDVKSELGGTIADLQKALDAQEDEIAELRKDLNQKISDLDAQLQKIKSCECPTDVESRLTSLENRMKTVYADYITSTQLASALAPYALLSQIPNVPSIANFVTNNQLRQYLQEELEDYITEQQLKGYLKDYVKDSEIPGTDPGVNPGTLNNYVKASELSAKVAELLANYNYLTSADLKEYALKGDLFDKTQLNNYLLKADLNLDKEFETRLAGVKDDIKALGDQLANLESDLYAILGSMVTGIIIQGTYNPVFGSFSAPLDVRTNFFAAYYGKTANGQTQFPTTRSTLYVNPDEALTAEDLKAIGDIEGADDYVGTLFNETEGNAGTVYLTVNPSSADFDKVSGFTLVNSQDVPSAFTVGALAKSDKLLTMGWDNTRAAGAALYEAPITLAEANIDDVKTVIDFAGLSAEVKKVYSERTKGSVIDLATKLYTEASGVQLPAYGVKYGWNDNLGDHNVYSQFSIAATAIQPLSYSFLYGIDGNKVTAPLFERAEKLVGTLFAQVKAAVPDLNIDASKLSFKVELSDADKANLKMNVPVNLTQPVNVPFTGETIVIDIPSKEYDLGGGVKFTTDAFHQEITPTGNASTVITINATIPVDMTATVEGLVNSINNSLAGSDLGSILESVKGLTKITSSIDGIQSRVNSFINKFHTMAGSLIENANAILQPVLLINTTDGLRKITNAEVGSPVIGTEATIVPTSYSAELLAPAFKKLVAVTAITKDGVAVDNSDVQAFNKANGLNKVLDGGVNAINVTGLQSGYVYEFVYTAVDYSGFVVAKKYYLNVQ